MGKDQQGGYKLEETADISPLIGELKYCYHISPLIGGLKLLLNDVRTGLLTKDLARPIFDKHVATILGTVKDKCTRMFDGIEVKAKA